MKTFTLSLVLLMVALLLMARHCNSKEEQKNDFDR